jgi:hypothetical protein
VLDAVRERPAWVVQLRDAHAGLAYVERITGPHLGQGDARAKLLEAHGEVRGAHLLRERVAERGRPVGAAIDREPARRQVRRDKKR